MAILFFLVMGFVLFIDITGWGQKVAEEGVTDDGYYEKVIVKTNLTNPDERDSMYYLYLVIPNTLTTVTEDAMSVKKVGPYKSDENGQFEIDLKHNFDIGSLIAKLDDDSTTLQVVVTSVEDIYMLNPLNDEDTYIEFVKNEDGETLYEYEYYSKVSNLDIDITDSYPNGVYSLHFRSADLIIKLVFPDGYKVNSPSYQINLVNEDGRTLGGNTRPSQYYEYPYYTENDIKNWNATISVKNLSTNEEIIYDDYPKVVTFDSNGNCNEGHIIYIPMPE